jgi:hypothetical protein
MWGRGKGVISCLIIQSAGLVLFSWHHARGKLFTSEDRSYRIRGSPPGHGPAMEQDQ